MVLAANRPHLIFGRPRSPLCFNRFYKKNPKNLHKTNHFKLRFWFKRWDGPTALDLNLCVCGKEVRKRDGRKWQPRFFRTSIIKSSRFVLSFTERELIRSAPPALRQSRKAQWNTSPCAVHQRYSWRVDQHEVTPVLLIASSCCCCCHITDIATNGLSSSKTESGQTCELSQVHRRLPLGTHAAFFRAELITYLRSPRAVGGGGLSARQPMGPGKYQLSDGRRQAVNLRCWWRHWWILNARKERAPWEIFMNQGRDDFQMLKKNTKLYCQFAVITKKTCLNSICLILAPPPCRLLLPD